MKSERRHELQHNELAEWLAKSAQTIKPYQNIALAAVLAVLIAVVGYTVWSRIAASHTAEAWDELSSGIESRNVAKLAQVIEDHPETTAAHMAALVLADNYLSEGCERLFVNKATAQPTINKAIELYDVVLEQSRVDSLLERATFGLARARESKADGENIKLAEQLYAEIGKRWPTGAFAAAASQRLSDLKRPSIKEMYDRFARFDPKPAFLPEPGQRPNFDMNELPEEGSAYMPKTTYDVDLGKNKGKGVLPPVKGDAKKDAAKPTEKGKVESKKPSDAAKPAADKTPPADTKAPAKAAK